MFSSRFMLFPTVKKKNFVYKKNFGGGGGGVELQFFLISRFMLFPTLKKILKPPVYPSVYPSVRHV